MDSKSLEQITYLAVAFVAGFFLSNYAGQKHSISHEDIRACALEQGQEMNISAGNATGQAIIAYNIYNDVMQKPGCAKLPDE